MERTPSLDDCLLFVAVAENAGLAGAMRATGVSVPTLSRKMRQLEDEMGQRLFARGPRGYALTTQGRALLAEAQDLRATSQRLYAFARSETKARVRITAGHWTAQFLARNIARYWTSDADWVPEFVASHAAVDIARREADIGIRNRRPEQSWLAGRRSATVTYAGFATARGGRGFITLPEEAANIPSVRWVRERHPNDIVTSVNDARLALDLALAGVGQTVLPLFAAAQYPALQQVTPLIDALTHDEWLVSHHEARHDTPIRTALDAIGALLSDKALRGASN